jgi:hypothetical protein
MSRKALRNGASLSLQGLQEGNLDRGLMY